MDWTQTVLRTIAAVGLTLVACSADSQTVDKPSAAPVSTEDALHAMSDAAGIIFTGSVTAIRRPSLPDGSPGGVVEVDFAVADWVRGANGPGYTLREWAGLWAANDQPLRIGKRYLMLLHTPNAAGLSSPVAGADGAIPIRGMGPAATPEGAAALPSGGAAMAEAASVTSAPIPPEETVDLGWVATHVAVPLVYSAAHSVSANPVSVHASSRGNASPEAAAGPAVSKAGSGLPANIPDVARSTSYSAVVQNLRAWEVAHVSAR